MSVAERNEIEAGGGARLLPFEGDERLRIPAGTEHDLACAVARYWAEWPEQRDAVLDRYEQAEQRLRENFNVTLGKGRISPKTLNQIKDKDPEAWAIVTFDPYFSGNGGPLGLELLGGETPFGIATHDEIPHLSMATVDEIRARPPVRLTSDIGTRGAVRGAPDPGDDELVVVVAGEPVALRLKDIVGPIPSAQRLIDAFTGDGGFPTKLEIRKLYHEVAQEFWTWRNTPSVKKTGRRPHTDSWFSGRDVVQVPSDAIAFSAHRALTSSIGWVMKRGAYPHFDDVQGGRPSGLRFSIGGFWGEEETDVANDLTILEGGRDLLDPATSIVHEAALAKWLHAHRSGTLLASGAVAIRVDEILEMRGLKKATNGGYKLEQKLDVSRRLMRLDKVFVRGGYTAPDGKAHTVSGRLLNVVVDEEYDLLGNPTPFAVLVRPGDAVWNFYAASDYLADYYLAIARLDTRQGVQRLAYLIGRYLINQFRVRESTQNFSQPFLVRTLLESARVQIEANASHYTRFREQFDDALERLAKDGVLATWQYAEGDEEGLPPVGWFAPWLRCRIVVTPPAAVIEQARIRSIARAERLRLATKKRSRKAKK